jgi:hypothetical protein
MTIKFLSKWEIGGDLDVDNISLIGEFWVEDWEYENNEIEELKRFILLGGEDLYERVYLGDLMDFDDKVPPGVTYYIRIPHDDLGIY